MDKEFSRTIFTFRQDSERLIASRYVVGKEFGEFIDDSPACDVTKSRLVLRNCKHLFKIFERVSSGVAKRIDLKGAESCHMLWYHYYLSVGSARFAPFSPHTALAAGPVPPELSFDPYAIVLHA